MRDVITYVFGKYVKGIKRFRCASEHKSKRKVGKNPVNKEGSTSKSDLLVVSWLASCLLHLQRYAAAKTILQLLAK